MYVKFKSYRFETFCCRGSVVRPSHPVMFLYVFTWNNLMCSFILWYGTVLLFPLLMLHVI